MKTPKTYKRRLANATTARTRFTTRARLNALTVKSPLYERIAQNWRAKLNFPPRADSTQRVHNLYQASQFQSQKPRRSSLPNAASRTGKTSRRLPITRGAINLSTEYLPENTRANWRQTVAPRRVNNTRKLNPNVPTRDRLARERRKFYRANPVRGKHASPLIKPFESATSRTTTLASPLPPSRTIFSTKRLANPLPPRVIFSTKRLANPSTSARKLNSARANVTASTTSHTTQSATTSPRFPATLNHAASKTLSARKLRPADTATRAQRIDKLENLAFEQPKDAYNSFNGMTIRRSLAEPQTPRHYATGAYPNRYATYQKQDAGIHAPQRNGAQPQRTRIRTQSSSALTIRPNRRATLFNDETNDANVYTPNVDNEKRQERRAAEIAYMRANPRLQAILRANSPQTPTMPTPSEARRAIILSTEDLPNDLRLDTQSRTQPTEAPRAILRSANAFRAELPQDASALTAIKSARYGVKKDFANPLSLWQAPKKRELPIDSILENLLESSGWSAPLNATRASRRNGYQREKATLTDSESSAYAPTTQTPGVKLDAIEQLLKDSREALRNLVRIANHDWTLDVP
ncbi:MAG: hypothetical protein Q4G03_11505 [Planctomycetia bacterium]|nr:hypothetical protein [Planctomycetia bacterium]